MCKRVESFLGSFTISWEQRKLGELVQFSKGAGYSKGDLKESGTPIILYGRLYTKYETVIADVDTFADAKNGSVYSRGGEVIVPASGETAEDISIASVVEKQGILLGGDLNIITPPADLDSAFLAISISNGKPHEDMSKMAQGKSVVHLHNTDLEKIDMTYPSHEEQTQISDLFRRIDNLITLHQRESYKYSLCHHDLSDVLECLLTIYWEQRKFEDIAVRSSAISSESGLPRVEYEDIISGIGRLNKDIFAKESDKSGMVFHKGDVLYGKLRPYLQNWLLPTFNGLAVGDFWVLQPQNADSSFLYRLVQSRQFDEVANQSTGTKMPRADWKLVSKTEFFIPSTIDEQSAIGTYFEQLDYLITLHQRKSPH